MNESSPQKSTKTLKVRRKIRIEKLIPKLKVFKIAKKINTENWNSPLPHSIKEDLILESCKTPNLFLSDNLHSTREVFPNSKSNDRHNLLTPTDIVGPKDNYYSKASLGRARAIRRTTKMILPLDKYRNANTKVINFDEKMKNIRKGIQTSRHLEEQEYEKLTPGGKITWLQQTKSLETYQRQKSYWEKISLNIADKVHKNPEELNLNSGRHFEIKKKEIEILDKLQKMNENRGMFYWTQTLRQGFYSEPEPPLVLSDEQISYLNSNKQREGKMLKNSKLSRDEEKGLRTSDYFKEKMSWYSKGTEEIQHFFMDNLEITGKAKLKMEIDAMRRKGTKNCVETMNEDLCEDVIEVNYSPKVIY